MFISHLYFLFLELAIEFRYWMDDLIIMMLNLKNILGQAETTEFEH